MASKEEAKPEGGGEVPAAKKSPMLLIAIVGIVALLALGGGGYWGYTKFFRHGGAEHAEAGHGGEKAEAKGEKAEGKGGQALMHEWDTFLVNLSDPGGKRYLKVTIKAELDSHEAEAEFAAKNMALRDATLMLLSSKAFEDIAGARGKAALKEAIVSQANKIMQHGQVKNIYFTEFLIQ